MQSDRSSERRNLGTSGRNGAVERGVAAPYMADRVQKAATALQGFDATAPMYFRSFLLFCSVFGKSKPQSASCVYNGLQTFITPIKRVVAIRKQVQGVFWAGPGHREST